MDRRFWKERKVFITGHTGFKGAWLALWLHALGADVYGYALPPHTSPALYDLCRLDDWVNSTVGDIRDKASLTAALEKAAAEIVIHMAAQTIVRESYLDPVTTFGTNIMGTANLLDVMRSSPTVKAAVIVTSDKCYQNRDLARGYREDDPVGGHDPYSASKGCTELVTASFIDSYFKALSKSGAGPAVASARAGNVIGGGDWAKDRLIPDCVRAILDGAAVRIRNPKAIRPWQHVLEPLSGYLLLARDLYENGSEYIGAWNFGPEGSDCRTVEWVLTEIKRLWPGFNFETDTGNHPHEDRILKLDCSKAAQRLGWSPRWDIEAAIAKTIEWLSAYVDGEDMRDICLEQIEEYVAG
jgi:CDP-glucose 4,6-dehydratase